MARSYFYNGHGIVTPVEYLDARAVYNSQSLSSRQLRTNPNIGQLWSMSFDIVIAQENIGFDSAAEFFVDAIQERTNVGSMVMPQFPGVDEYPTVHRGLYAVGSDTASGISTIDMDTPSGVSSGDKLLAKGTFVQFSNHSKVYLVKKTVVATAADVASNGFQLSIYPELITAITTAHTMKTPYSDNRPEYRYWRDLSSLNGVVYEDSKIVSPGKIKLIEAL